MWSSLWALKSPNNIISYIVGTCDLLCYRNVHKLEVSRFIHIFTMDFLFLCAEFLLIYQVLDVLKSILCFIHLTRGIRMFTKWFPLIVLREMQFFNHPLPTVGLTETLSVCHSDLYYISLLFL
jgi:hypothetical protein